MLKQVLMLVALLGAADVARAQVTDQPEIVVTASAMPQTVDAALASVSVIDRAEIEASGAPDVYALLRLEPGVNIVRSGGPGTQTTVFLRGTNSNHVLVLIDGVRVASLNTGAFAWEQLPLDAVERIEIVRGPRATVWGSDAIGGVIQIFTRKLEGAAVAVRYGSHDDATGSFGFGHWNDQGEGFSIHAGIRHADGISAQNLTGFSFHPDDDGLRNRNLSVRGAVKVSTQRLSASGFFSDSVVEFDQGVSHNIEQAVGVDLQGELAPGWGHRLSFGSAREDLSTPAFSNRFRSHRKSLAWRHHIKLGPHQQLTAGAELVHERGANIDTSSGTNIFDGERDNRALFLGWFGQRERIDWELSARHDDNDVFGAASTGSAALGVRMTPDLRLVASWGQGFRAPNLNEQFSPGFGGYYAGNSALEPERSHSSELALEWNPTSELHMRLSHYRTEIDQLISFTRGELFQAENIAHARINGTEASLDWHNAVWSVQANATWQDPRNLDSDTPLLRRPRQKASVVLSRALGERSSAGLEWSAVGARPELGGPLPGYTLVHARFNLELGQHTRVNLRVNNLLDRNYTELRGFNTLGRTFWAQFAWRQKVP